MLTRQNSIWLLLLCCWSTAYSQTKQDNLDLQRDLAAYQRATLKLNYDSLLAYMPPTLLDMVPREQLRSQLESAFNNEELYMVLDSMRYGPIPQAGKTGEYLYARVPYDGHMQMHFKTQRDSAFMELMVSMLENQFGKGMLQQVVSTDSTRYLSISTRGKFLLAYKKPAFDSWKFIEDKREPGVPDDSQQIMLIKMIVPAEVLEATAKQ